MGWIKRVFSLFEDKRELLDLSSFNDELALSVSWDPLVKGGTNFCTHRLKPAQGSDGCQLIFKTSPTAVYTCWLMIGAGILGFVGHFVAFVLQRPADIKDIIPCLI